MEHVHSGPGGYTGADREQQIILHTLWGGCVNRPIALALEAAWRERFASAADVHADNNAIVVQIKEEVDPALFLSLVTPANFEPMLRRALESSAFFGARFRECAGRALLLTKRNFKQRMPLVDDALAGEETDDPAIKPMQDFPILLETWRTCLNDEFDLPSGLRSARKARRRRAGLVAGQGDGTKPLRRRHRLQSDQPLHVRRRCARKRRSFGTLR